MNQENRTAVRIEPVDEHGIPLVLEMIRELAEYENLLHQLKADEETMTASLLGDNPAARGLLLFQNDEPAGYCIYFYNFSTFWGRPGIYVEDIYVKPKFRRLGLGRAVFRKLGRLAAEKNCARLEFAVLDWNEPALEFYKSMGAEPLTEWVVHRFEGESLKGLAEMD